MSWATLPLEVRQNVLQYVPLTQRLLSCSLVSMMFRRAAVAAPQELVVPSGSGGAERSEGLMRWLHNHGQHITSLSINRANAPLQLPCPKLLQLHMHGCGVGLPSAGSASSTGVTQLCINSCWLQDAARQVSLLTSLSKLQHLELSYLGHGLELELQTSGLYRPGMDLPSAVLQHFTQLTHLTLRSADATRPPATAQSLLHISALCHLRELCLQGATSSGGALSLRPSTAPGISCLTALTALELCYVSLAPAVLQPVTQLQQLTLCEVRLQAASSFSGLLAHIAQLPLLRQLVLAPVIVFDTGGLPAGAAVAAPTVFAALTASSCLQHLNLGVVGKNPVPQEAWRHVFPEGRRLSQCTCIKLRRVCAALTSADVSRLVSCCPGLQQLELALRPDVQPGSLTQLTALTQLQLRGPDQSCMQPLAALTGLCNLVLERCRGLTLAACLPLTSLQQLTHFEFFRHGRQAASTSLPARNSLMFAARQCPGQPEVWRQLEHACEEDAA